MRYFVEFLDPPLINRKVGIIDTVDIFGYNATNELLDSVDNYRPLNNMFYISRTKIIGGKNHGNFLNYNGQRILKVRSINFNSFFNIHVLFNDEVEATNIRSFDIKDIQALIDFYSNINLNKYTDFYFF